MKIDLSKEKGALVPLYFFRKRDRLRLTEDRPLTLTRRDSAEH